MFATAKLTDAVAATGRNGRCRFIEPSPGEIVYNWPVVAVCGLAALVPLWWLHRLPYQATREEQISEARARQPHHPLAASAPGSAESRSGDRRRGMTRAMAFSLQARVVFPVDRPPIEHGVVTIDGERIVAVGTKAEASDVIDLGDVALLPGLVNAHTHLEFSYLQQPLGEAGNAAGRLDSAGDRRARAMATMIASAIDPVGLAGKPAATA